MTYSGVDNISIDVQIKLNEQKMMNKRNISDYTFSENNEVRDTVTKLEILEKKKLEQNEPYKNIDQVNCKELIQKANRDIKNLYY